MVKTTKIKKRTQKLHSDNFAFVKNIPPLIIKCKATPLTTYRGKIN